MTMTEPLRVVVYKDGEAWVAQALEHDICVHANNLGTLYQRLAKTVEIEMGEGNGLADIDPAPKRFESMWTDAPGRYEPAGPPSSLELKLCA